MSTHNLFSWINKNANIALSSAEKAHYVPNYTLHKAKLCAAIWEIWETSD